MDVTGCHHLHSPNPYTVGLASFILLGILVSYIPQHLKIILRRSSDGLSPYWVLLGGLSSIAAIGNILVLPVSRRDIACCKVVSGGECAAALLGVGQIGLQWACFMFIVMLFLIFFPTEPAETTALSHVSNTPPAPKRRDAIIVGLSILAALLVVGICSLVILALYPHHTQTYADTLGTIASTLAMIQYLPQIYTTFLLGEIKSLSIITMLIQVPGSFLFAFSLWLRVGWEGWSTWVVYLVTGTLQGILLGLAISYWLVKRKEQKRSAGSAVEGTGEDAVDERTALLGNGHSHKTSTLPARGMQSNPSELDTGSRS